MAGRIVVAAGHTGIGLTVLPVFYAHSAFGGLPPSEGQRRFICGVDQYSRLMELTRKAAALLAGTVVGIAPDSLRAVTPEELAAIQPLAGGGPIHIHAAEQVREVEDCQAWSGQRPVEWLLGAASVDRRWCLIHSTHVNADETRRLASCGAVAESLRPITESNLGDGIFPATDFVNAGGAFGIGTDSNVLINVGQELRQLEYSQRLRIGEERRGLGGADRSTGRVLYEAAVNGGAQALGVRAGISVGAPADMFSLAADDVMFAGRSEDRVLDTFIFAGGERCIDRVWRGGKCVVEKGRHRARANIERAIERRSSDCCAHECESAAREIHAASAYSC